MTAYSVQIEGLKGDPREKLTPVLVDEVRRSEAARSSGNGDELVTSAAEKGSMASTRTVPA